MAPQPLRKNRIIVTRPAAQAQSIVDKLTNAGFQSLAIPALEIAPFEDATQVQLVSSIIQRLDEFLCLIFVSQNAVAYGFDWIEDYWPQFPERLNCLAIGSKTAAKMRHRMERLSSATAIAQDHSAMTSEELLEHPLLQDVKDKKILIFKGSGGRTKISDAMSERGAQVEYCELYQRMLPEASLGLVCNGDIDPVNDTLTIFSGESLENFHFLLSKANIENWQSLLTVVPSKRIAKQAEEMGFMHVFAAKNANEDEMLSTVQSALNTK